MSFIRAAEFAHAMGRIDTPMGETLSVGALPIARRRTRSQRNSEATCYRKNLVDNNAYPHAPFAQCPLCEADFLQTSLENKKNPGFVCRVCVPKTLSTLMK
jgi:hypothetical protein